MDLDCYEIIVKDNKQYLTYNGEILPNQLKSTIIQGVEQINGTQNFCIAVIEVRAVLKNTEPVENKET